MKISLEKLFILSYLVILFGLPKARSYDGCDIADHTSYKLHTLKIISGLAIGHGPTPNIVLEMNPDCGHKNFDNQHELTDLIQSCQIPGVKNSAGFRVGNLLGDFAEEEMRDVYERHGFQVSVYSGERCHEINSDWDPRYSCILAMKPNGHLDTQTNSPVNNNHQDSEYAFYGKSNRVER